MHLIRPIRLNDLDALLRMAKSAGAGFTSLPPVREYLKQKIELSLDSFAAKPKKPGHERYMFVLEHGASGDVGGCCAVEAACGLDEPFYNYHVGTTVHASRELGIYKRTPTLYLANDYTGTSVLCSLYLRPEFRENNNGRLLSKSRFLFMAQFQKRFAEKIIAEMRGVSNARGRSPFWEVLGRNFFGLDYSQAEHTVGMGNKAFIAELMPKHPIYTVMLPKEAQKVLGQVHPHTAPALKLLEEENFRYQGYIDIFDGGPTVEAPLKEIRSIKRSRLLEVKTGTSVSGPLHLIANTSLSDYRCTLLPVTPARDHLALDAATLKALKVKPGETVRVAALG